MKHELHRDQPPRLDDLTPDQRAALEQRIRQHRARVHRNSMTTGGQVARQQPGDPSASFQQFTPQDDRPRRYSTPAAGRRTTSLMLSVVEGIGDIAASLRAGWASLIGRKRRRG